MTRLFKKYLNNYKANIFIIVISIFLSTFSTLALPSLCSKIIDIGIINSDKDYIVRIGALMFVIAILGYIMSIISNHFVSRVSSGFVSDLSKGLFKHSINLSQSNIDNLSAASLISRQTNDINQVGNALTSILQMMLLAPLMCIGAIILAISSSPQLAWIIAVILPLALIFIAIIIPRTIPLSKQMQLKIDGVNRILRENLNGMRVIRAFRKEKYEIDRFEKINDDLMKHTVRVNRNTITLIPVITLLVNVANILIIWVGGHKMLEGSISVGNIQSFIQYITLILTSFTMSMIVFIRIPRASASAERINDVFNTQSPIQDKEKFKTLDNDAKSSIKFKDVYFRYPGSDQDVLSGLNFEAYEGQTLAIIGGTGSGKSTLVNLIPRFYEVTSGAIKINDIDIRDLKQEDLRNTLAFVPQKSFLFAGSIFDNIRYGKKDATEEDVLDALDISQASEFIRDKEFGIYSYITQGGTNVSGGQRQRLAIARAVVRKSKFIIFDDSFSALDFKTDAMLRKSLDEELSDTIKIIVAQRVGTIMSADRILVLENGVIVGDGTHEELVKNCDTYKEIVRSQFSESEVS